MLVGRKILWLLDLQKNKMQMVVKIDQSNALTVTNGNNDR